jgi:RNA polymerase sigma factor (sigma-70 family)
MGGAASRFPVTRQSVVLALQDADPSVHRRAADLLIGAYWKPVYKYLRLKWNADPDQAQDLTQGFFTSMLEREALKRYDPDRARFRTYLRTCVDGYASNERKAASRLKRGGAFEHLSLDFESAEGEVAFLPAADDVDADAFFHQEWVRSLFSLAVDGLREWATQNRRELHFQIFARYDLDREEEQPPTYAQLADEFDVDVNKVTNTLHAARKRFREILLEKLRETCGSEQEYREEARALLGAGAA